MPQSPAAAPIVAKANPEPEQQKAAAPQSAPAEKPAAIVAEVQPKREAAKAPEIAKPATPEANPPASAVEPAKKPERLALSLRFALNSAVVNKKYREEAARLAKFLTDNPTARVTIEGHADAIGEADYNQRLSERRAKALAQILMKTHKIAPERIVTAGYGETRPAASNDTAEGRAENRRVLATVTIGE
jgi:OOP family OmpA-OmpF porin